MPQIGDIARACDLRHTKKKDYSIYIWVACIDCCKERWVPARAGLPLHKRCPKCSAVVNKKVGVHNRNWKGGRTISRGYVMVRLSPDDFFYPMATKAKYVSEHRLVMAKHLGRCLLSWEVIHHKNGIRSDNCIENLELLPTSKYHLVDTILKSRLNRLEKLVEKQAQQIKLLQWHIKELNKIKV